MCGISSLCIQRQTHGLCLYWAETEVQEGAHFNSVGLTEDWEGQGEDVNWDEIFHK